MTIHEPVEKNLKHKTDVISWGDVPWDDCDLNFRPPSLSRLSLSAGAVYRQLLVAASISVCAVAALNRWVTPLMMAESSWIEAVVVAALVGTLVSVGRYRPLPRVVSSADTRATALLMSVSVVAFYLIIRMSESSSLFDTGILLLFTAAIPSCLLAADQLTGHALHWWTADPAVDRDTMVAWRNAWCGRFMTRHVDELVSYGVDPSEVTVLKRYWWGHVAIVALYLAAALASLLIAYRFHRNEVGLIFLSASTLMLLLVAAGVDLKSQQSGRRIAQVMGQWFLYLKDSAQPPWVLQSPAGPQLGRAFQSYVGVGGLSVSFWVLGLVTASAPTQSLAELQGDAVFYTALVGGVAALLAPLHWLLICFVVSGATLSGVESGLIPQDQAGEI